MLKLLESPTRSPAAAIVFIGTNHHGNWVDWVVRKQGGFFGGIFLNRVQTFKYVLSEIGYGPEATSRCRTRPSFDNFETPQAASKRDT